MNLKKLQIGYKKAFMFSIIAVLILLSLNIYTLAQLNNYFTVPVPSSYDLVPKGIFTVEGITFVPDVNQRYESCDVIVRNTDSENAHSGTVTVTLKDKTGSVLATITSAKFTITPPDLTTQVTVGLTAWNTGTWADLGNSTLLITPT